MLGLSFQLASLEENAAIYLWVMHIFSCWSTLLLLFLKFLVSPPIVNFLSFFSLSARLLLSSTKQTVRAQSRI